MEKALMTSAFWSQNKRIAAASLLMIEGIMLACIGGATGPEAHAATPPDSCFGFSSAVSYTHLTLPASDLV